MKVFALSALCATALAFDGKVDWSDSYREMLTTNLATCPPGTRRDATKKEGQNCFACLPDSFAEGMAEGNAGINTGNPSEELKSAQQEGKKEEAK